MESVMSTHARASLVGQTTPFLKTTPIVSDEAARRECN